MSEDQLAHKMPPPATPSEAEYESIYAAAMKTDDRPLADDGAPQPTTGEVPTDLAAIRRAETAMHGGGSESLELFLFDIADMAQAIVRTKAEIAAIKPPPDRLGQLDDATGELDSIVRTTESATSSILAAAERVQEIAWTLREKGTDESLCDQLDAQATEIYTACSFQDLTGQRTRKVIQVLRYLEHRVNTMIEIWGKDVAPAPSPIKSAEEALLNGPSAGGLNQAQVDRMMHAPAPGDEMQEEPREESQTALQAAPAAAAKIPRDERRDATIEDIERVMIALDPFVAAGRDASDEETAATVDETGAVSQGIEAAPAASFEEQRPELSTAAAVSHEAVTAPAEAEAAFLEQSFKEALLEPAPQPEAAAADDDDQPEVQEFAMEFGMSARTTAVLLQVQAAAPRAVEELPPTPTEESAWSVLERLALTLLPQPLVPQAAIMQEQPEPAPDEPAAYAEAPALPEPPAPVKPVAVIPFAELDFPAARLVEAEPPPADPEPAAEETEPPPVAESYVVELEEVIETEVNETAETAEQMVPPAPEPETAAAAPLEDVNPSAAALEIDADEFLFAPDHPPKESEPADFLLEPMPTPAPPAQPLPAMQLERAGASEPAAAPRPLSVPASFARPVSKLRAPNDPLAPLRALSDEEKIALFS